MSDLKYAVTSVKTILSNEESKAQFEELLREQWVEVDHRRKTSDLKVDFDKYIQMGELGVHYVVVAYTDSKLVGYNSMFLSVSPHTGELTATTDTIFLRKEYRATGAGSKLVSLGEVEAKAKGAQNIMVTFKNDQPHPNIVKEHGFFSYETIYAKYIGD